MSTITEPITHAELLRLMHYNDESGVLTWISAPTGRSSGGFHLIGSRAGTPNPQTGYRRVTINRRRYQEHRIAWLYVHGTWPTEIDHANGDKQDNRLENLRNASRAQNSWNMRGKANRAGLKGASWDRTCQRFIALIRVGNGRRKYLGRFKTAEEAHAAYCAAATSLHGEFARHE